MSARQIPADWETISGSVGFDEDKVTLATSLHTIFHLNDDVTMKKVAACRGSDQYEFFNNGSHIGTLQLQYRSHSRGEQPRSINIQVHAIEPLYAKTIYQEASGILTREH